MNRMEVLWPRPKAAFLIINIGCVSALLIIAVLLPFFRSLEPFNGNYTKKSHRPRNQSEPSRNMISRVGNR